ncbi:MAG: ribonuclease H-like domain-containing protein [Lachnospiraceae bacterium]|jgi:hypothetical protein|nr:ribonuclease H-like domain-containing protein [Lachnospiraceae bacterium]
MITANEPIDISPSYPLENLGPKETLLLFDIETTGLSPSSSFIYLIGVLFYQDSSWKIKQWLAQSPEEESDLLTAFSEFARNYRVLIHFNGDAFDIPFVKKRWLAQASDCLCLPESLDLYKRLRPLKKLLGLSKMNLKSLEQYLGIARKDELSGRELIPLYFNYTKNRDLAVEKLLLLHNRDDLSGTLDLTALLSYTDFLLGGFTVEDQQTGEGMDGVFETVFFLKLTQPLPQRISCPLAHGYLTAQDTSCRILLKGISGTLKYFFSDYRSYYYLPAEDTAMHKSVAAYVDKSHRVQAKASTCYCKKTGLFLPCPSLTSQPLFYLDYGSTPAYLECSTAFLDDAAALHDYLTGYLNETC